jgi:hypothetical protein
MVNWKLEMEEKLIKKNYIFIYHYERTRANKRVYRQPG